MYYVGCHWGRINDGYICSSKWMKNAYILRPYDFKRRILEVTENRDDLYNVEYKWISMIKLEECVKRYYNLNLHQNGYKCGISNSLIGIKISNALTGKTKKHSEETKQKISASHKGKLVSVEARKNMSKAQLGKKQSDETKTKRSNTLKGKPRSEETKLKISNSRKGIKPSIETRIKMSLIGKMRNNLIREAKNEIRN